MKNKTTKTHNYPLFSQGYFKLSADKTESSIKETSEREQVLWLKLCSLSPIPCWVGCNKRVMPRFLN